MLNKQKKCFSTPPITWNLDVSLYFQYTLETEISISALINWKEIDKFVKINSFCFDSVENTFTYFYFGKNYRET